MKTKTRTKRGTDRPDPHAPQPIELRVGMSREEIYAAYGMTCPPRIATLRNPARPTYGPALARISSQLGQPPMPHQRYMMDVGGEVNPQSRALVYRDLTGLLPRQSGKTTIILPLRVHRAVAMPGEVRKYAPHQIGRQRLVYAAQTRLDAADKWLDEQMPLLDASPFAGRYKLRLSTGKEALIWKTGAIDSITANKEDAGHGKIFDLGVEDEFFHAVDARLEAAWSPGMVTRWSPQHWRVSTEGTEASLYLAIKVTIGRELEEQRERDGLVAGDDVPIAYFDWSNLEDRWDRPETWLSCMPALCPKPTGECDCGVDESGKRWWRHTVRLSTIAAELKKHGKAEFCRAYLNRRRGSMIEADPNVPPYEQFEALKDELQKPSDVLAFAIDMSPARTAAAILAVWLCTIDRCPSRRYMRVDGVLTEKLQTAPHVHWRVIEYRGGEPSWVAGRAKQLDEKWQPVAWGLDIAGPAGGLEESLKKVGIKQPEKESEPKRGDLAVPNARQAAQAFGMTVDLIRADLLRHEGQQPLMDAYGNARTRPLGDGGLAWARRQAGGDICTLVAGTTGTWALEERKHLALQSYDALSNIW